MFGRRKLKKRIQALEAQVRGLTNENNQLTRDFHKSAEESARLARLLKKAVNSIPARDPRTGKFIARR